MKTLVISAIIASVTASASFATSAWSNDNDVSWNGNSGVYHSDGCSYKDQDNGEMELDGLVWSTTKAATIRIKSHGSGNIKVTSSNSLVGGGLSFPVTVNYNGTADAESSITSAKGTSQQVNNNMISYQTAQNGVTQALIKIGGTATMHTATGDAIVNNTDYTITHTVTCLQ